MRLCIVDDHEVVREGLRNVLQKDPELEIVGEAGSGEEALRRVRQTLPDVVITDYRLPDTSGSELCEKLRKGFPSIAVVVLTTYLNEEVVRQSMDAGAAAFVTKASGLDELRRVLARIAAGEPPSFPGGSGAVVQRLHQASAPADRRITPQQERVLELAAEGLTYGEIATRLSISKSTVRFHIQALKDRLGVKTKTELIALAIRTALISPGAEASAT